MQTVHALFTDDNASTIWGCQYQIEPGSFTVDHVQDAAALAKLHQLGEEHPSIDVRLGHQALPPRRRRFSPDSRASRGLWRPLTLPCAGAFL